MDEKEAEARPVMGTIFLVDDIIEEISFFVYLTFGRIGNR